VIVTDALQCAVCVNTRTGIIQMGNEQLTPYEIGERRRLIQQLDRTSRARYLADAKKGAHQEFYYAEKELKDFNRELRKKGVKV